MPAPVPNGPDWPQCNQRTATALRVLLTVDQARTRISAWLELGPAHQDEPRIAGMEHPRQQHAATTHAKLWPEGQALGVAETTEACEHRVTYA